MSKHSISGHDTRASSDSMKPGKRKWLLFSVPIATIVIGLALYWHGGRFVETDNAYIKAQKIPVSPTISGVVQAVLVSENQRVASGQVLFRIDPLPFRIEVDKSAARLAQVRTELTSLKAAFRAKQSEVLLARNNLAFAQKELQRQTGLAEKNFISAAKLDDARHAADVASQQVAILEQDLLRLSESLGGDADANIESHPNYRAAMAELAQAKLDLDNTEVRASIAGTVSKSPNAGQYVTTGNTAMLLVADDVWIEANFTEADLTHVHPGQAAIVHVDSFPGAELKGSVESLAPATGSEFSVIPAQNATGNWVKISQRLTVRIKLEHLAEMPDLRAGLSSWVEIDTGHRRRLLGISL
ncbi:MAG: HlyD family secretion protein [Sideroxydans sp.]|nr:HlyD family secretion protein [Sideroxydans sp.]